MEKNESKQIVKGDGNTQTVTNVTINNGNYVDGLQKEEVLKMIQEYCQVDKDQIIQTVLERINSIDVNNRRMPEKRVFVPLLQQLSYSSDDEPIKEFYKKLLASSMDSTKTVHPAFVQIISQLNSDEAKILNSMAPVQSLNYPLINVRIKGINERGSGLTIIANFSDIGYGKCDYPTNICAYLENLERLKIIEIPPYVHLLDETKYNKLEQHPDVVYSLKNYSNNSNLKIEYDKKVFRLTRFGVSFLNACKGERL